MSDEEYEYDYGSEAGSNQDDGSGDEETPAGLLRIEVENVFYEGENLISEGEQGNPKEAIVLFEKAVALDTQLGALGEQIKWRFKALQHLVTLNFQIGNYAEMVAKYEAMLNDMSLVTRNDCTEAIDAVLGAISDCKDDAMLVRMFEITLTALKTANNERQWFNTNIKLARLYLNDLMHKRVALEELLQILKASCTKKDGSHDQTKASYLLEIYCQEIVLCRLTNDGVRMREVYPKTLQLNAAVEDPRIMGVIREEGGKMHLNEGDWDMAYNELSEAFRNFQAAGSDRAKTCLKYAALASMLSVTALNPFDAREARVYVNDPEIKAMSDLRMSLQENNLKAFEKVLADTRNGIANEAVLMKYISPLRHRMHEHVLLNIVIPYKKVRITFLATQLNMDVDYIENILVSLIQQGNLKAAIDQINGVVVIGSSGSSRDASAQKSRALTNWAHALDQLNSFMIPAN